MKEGLEACELPAPLAPRDIPDFIRPYGYYAETNLLWGRVQPPELVLRVTGHSEKGKHTYYDLECRLTPRAQFRPESQAPQYDWKVSRRLAHLREGLHDPLRRALGSSYQTYFSGVHFARHLGPAGTTARLDTWCQRLAQTVSNKLAPPEIAAAVLQVLEAPDPVAAALQSRSMAAPPPCSSPSVLGTMNGIPGSCGAGGLFDLKAREADSADDVDPDKDTLASEGASASTAEPGHGAAASVHTAAFSTVASEDSGSSAASPRSFGDGAVLEDESPTEPGFDKEAALDFEPCYGRRRVPALQ